MARSLELEERCMNVPYSTVEEYLKSKVKKVVSLAGNNGGDGQQTREATKRQLTNWIA